MHSIFSRRSAPAQAGAAVPRRSRSGLLALGVLGAIAYLWYRGWANAGADSSSLGKEVEKWEGEGGNVPDVPSVHPAALPVPPTLH